MGPSMMNGFIRRSWQIKLRSFLSSIRILMGYSDVDISVYVNMLGPLYVFPGPEVDGIHCYRLRDAQSEGMPWYLARPPIKLVHYSLGMPWCPTRSPRVRVLVGMFGCSCCVNWCLISLV